MSVELFRNQEDSNAPPAPLKWIGSTNENKTIPEWLSGIYLQIGPSYFDFNAKGETTVKQLQQSLVQLKIIHFRHWFDGISHVHRLELQGGTDVALWNHSVISKPYQERIIETGNIDQTTFGVVGIENHEVSSAIIDSFKFKPPQNDNSDLNKEKVCNNNLGIQTVNYGNKEHVIVTGNSSIIEEINPMDYTSTKIGELTHSSFYPTSRFVYTPFKKYDPETNELFSLVLEVGKVSSSFHVLCTTFPSDKYPERKEPQTNLFTTIANVRAGYVHNFAITEHFIIIMNCPYHAGTIGSGLKFSLNQGSIQKTMKFSDLKDENAICYVISRENKALVRSFESASFFFLNIVNSFEGSVHEEVNPDGIPEKKYDIYLDVVAYSDAKVLNIFEVDQLRTQSLGDNTINKDAWSNTVRRYCLPGVSCIEDETVRAEPGGIAYWEQVVKDKVENPSSIVNSIVKPFAKLYYTASGIPQPEDPNAAVTSPKSNSDSNIKLEALDASSKRKSVSNASLESNGLKSKFDGSDLNIRFEYPASFQHLSNTTIEFPCINNNYNYKDYRFIYGLFHPKKEKVFFTHLIKLDIQTMRVIKFDPLDITADPYKQEGDVVIPMMNEKVIIVPAGAPTFVPRISDVVEVIDTDDIDYTTEDDGALIVPFFDLLNRRSLIIVVDAKTFREIGRITLPNNEFMPFGSQSTFCHA